MTRAAIAGATGYIGGRLAPALLEEGYSLRCLVRDPRKLGDRDWAASGQVEIQKADLTDRASLTEALRGCVAGFYLVHSMMSAGSDYAERDLQLARTFAEASRDAGVERIIYLGGLGETGQDLSRHLASRREVEAALASAGVPVTVFRAAMIIGSGSASFEILRYLVQRLPVMITPKWVSTPCQPISVENVLTYLVESLGKPETTGQVYDIGGPDIMNYNQIMRVMADELKLPRRIIIPVPVLTPRLSSWWIQFITPLSHSIARPLAEGLKNPVVCRDDRITKIIPQRLLSLREAIKAAVQQVSTMEVETNWSMAGPIAGDPDWSGGTVFRDERTVEVDAPASAVFKSVTRLGGKNGWFSGNILWKIRGWLDRVAGGPGLRRGRRHPENLRFGDALDFWRVIAVEKDKRLALRAEMKMPGEAMLEFLVEPLDDRRCKLTQRALFQPKGLAGLAYWYGVAPFHNFLFAGMLKGIAGKAVKMASL